MQMCSLRTFSAQLLLILCLSSFAYADNDGNARNDGNDGNAGNARHDAVIGGYFEYSFISDRRIFWSGSEATFTPLVRLTIEKPIEDNIGIYLSAMWTPTVNEHSIGYVELKKREAYPEDLYIYFGNFMQANGELRLGMVKVPFGIFNLLTLGGPHSMPMTTARTREWDVGVRYDVCWGDFGISFATINGDGNGGTDANSDKSFSLRVVYPEAEIKRIYPATINTVSYHSQQAPGSIDDYWLLGMSAYYGDKYSTPIKERNKHYDVDLTLSYGIVSFAMQASYLEGGFTDESVRGATFTDSTYSSGVTTDIDTYNRGAMFSNQIVVRTGERTLISLLTEWYDPDLTSDATPKQRTKSRFVVGASYSITHRTSLSAFFATNQDPYLDGIDAEKNASKGGNVYMASVAASF